MNRRNALIALLSIPIGAFGFKKAEGAGARLSIDLGQWSSLLVIFDGRQTEIKVAEIFAALSKKDNA